MMQRGRKLVDRQGRSFELVFRPDDACFAQVFTLLRVKTGRMMMSAVEA